MNAKIRRRLERALRVREFLRAHQMDGGVDQAAVTRLDELIARAEALASQQRSGVIAEHKSAEQRRKLRRSLHTTLLRNLARVATVAVKENADLAAEFELPPRSVPHQALLTVARGMLEKATAQKAALMSRGMPQEVLDALGTALADFEHTLEESRSGRLDHVGARVDLDTTMLDVTHQLQILDTLVRYRFGENSELMGAWKSAYNVEGPFKSKAEPEGPASEAPKEVKSAA